MQTPRRPPARRRAAPAAATHGEPAIKPFDGSNVFLFTPAPAYRMHYSPIAGRPDLPEYPPAGARIDYYLASPSGEVKLEILDAPERSCGRYIERRARRGAGGTRRRTPRRRAAVDAADKGRHEPVRLGSAVSRRTCDGATVKAAGSAAADRSSRPARTKRGSRRAA